MTSDEVKVAVNELKDQMRATELRLDNQGYRELARTIYDARLRLSHALSDVCGWTPLEGEDT